MHGNLLELFSANGAQLLLRFVNGILPNFTFWVSVELFRVSFETSNLPVALFAEILWIGTENNLFNVNVKTLTHLLRRISYSVKTFPAHKPRNAP